MSATYYKAGSTPLSEFTEVWFTADGQRHPSREPMCVEAMAFDDGLGWMTRFIADAGGMIQQDFSGNPRRETLRGLVSIRTMRF